MLAKFNMEKAIQAAGVLLNTTEARRMSRLRLLKLLYIADREAIEHTGTPITGDDAVAMPNGPVLSRTYEAITGEGYDVARWRQFLRTSGRWDVELAEDPGVQKLSRYEVRKLQEVADRFAELDDWALVEHTHQFPEWQQNAPGDQEGDPQSNPIAARDILAALGMEAEADELLSEAKAYRKVDQLLTRAENR